MARRNAQPVNPRIASAMLFFCQSSGFRKRSAYLPGALRGRSGNSIFGPGFGFLAWAGWPPLSAAGSGEAAPVPPAPVLPLLALLAGRLLPDAEAGSAGLGQA